MEENKLEKINFAKKEFYNFTGCSELNVQVNIVEDIYLEKLKYANDINRDSIKQQKDIISNFNGTIIEPLKFNEPFIILVNETYFNKNEYNHWIGTICHEMTHVWDYLEYAHKKGYDTYVELVRDKKYNLFSLWSEFHARYIGHYVLRKTLQKDQIKSEGALIDLIKRELPEQINIFVEECKNDQNQLYSAMQFLGRLKVWQELFPDFFTNELVNEMLRESKLTRVFKFLKINNTVDLIINNLEELENVIMKDLYGFE